GTDCMVGPGHRGHDVDRPRSRARAGRAAGCLRASRRPGRTSLVGAAAV
ncbi:MAG: hypothetical protein AVDCRST_MAG52-3141, partial [uncultured Blastococcus sp.]